MKRVIRCKCGLRVRLDESECPYNCVCGRLVSFDGKILAESDQVRVFMSATGPGTELKLLLKSIGIVPSISCNCNAMMRKMNEWGVDECRLHFAEIVTSMEEDAKKYSWHQRVTAAGKGVMEGLAFKINPFNPIPDLVLEAIRRAETNPSC